MRHVPGFRVIENHYPAGLELARHTHDHAYLSYVLEGPYSESYANSASVTCSPRVLRYLPIGPSARERFRTRASHCLIVEVDREALKRVNEHTPRSTSRARFRESARHGSRSVSITSSARATKLALVSLEGILLEMLAEGARHAGSTGPVAVIPRWPADRAGISGSEFSCAR